MRKRFSPEFVNRIDVVNTYFPLDREALDRILDQQLDQFRRHVVNRLGQRAFTIELSEAAREFLLSRGTSAEYGARELKRVIHRHLIQPVSAAVGRGSIPAGCHVEGDYEEGAETITLEAA